MVPPVFRANRVTANVEIDDAPRRRPIKGHPRLFLHLHFDTRLITFSTAGPIQIGSHGKYSYEGIAYEYGPEHQPLGQEKVKVSGKVTSTKVTAKYSLPGCKSTKGSVSANRD